MHFSTTTFFITTAVTLSLLLSSSSTSAQTLETPTCKQCIISARTASFPVCSSLVIPTPPSTGWNAQERDCYCGAANSLLWVDSCNKLPEFCNNRTINSVKSTYQVVKYFCDAGGIRPIPPATGGGGGGTLPPATSSPDKEVPASSSPRVMRMPMESVITGIAIAAVSASLGAML